MLTLNFIRTHKEKVLNGLKVRNFAESELKIVDDVIALDDRRKANQTELDNKLAEINQLSREIGELYKSNQRDAAEQMKSKVATIKRSAKECEIEREEISRKLEDLLLAIPNVPHESVPKGSNEEDNEVVMNSERPAKAVTDGLPHWELAKKYDLIDFELGTKITGSGFPLYRGKGAKLERSLINFFLDEATSAGYEEIIPPLLVNSSTARATGQLPDKEGQMYHCEKDDLYLIPTSEVPLTNIYRNVILRHDDFPRKLTGYTPCFRREAGSYGADVKGLNRVHQFDKVEVVQVVHPDQSYKVLDEMVNHVEQLLKKLELPYRILRLCGGDLGFTSALTFDFEVFSAGQQRWLEVSSVSNFETFQSNRLKLRYTGEDGKKHLAHTLNGSALALARIVAALLENNQFKNGIKIPAVLQPYTKFDIIN